jgi:hypothetical protein
MNSPGFPATRAHGAWGIPFDGNQAIVSKEGYTTLRIDDSRSVVGDLRPFGGCIVVRLCPSIVDLLRHNTLQIKLVSVHEDDRTILGEVFVEQGKRRAPDRAMSKLCLAAIKYCAVLQNGH